MTLGSKKAWIVLGSLVIILGGILFVSQFLYVEKAHSTFDNYYAFRGCTKLIDRTATSADCEIGSGETIRIVQDHGGWYLDGDLPACWFNFCF